MDRAPGLSVRLKLTLSYAAFLMLAGVVLLAVVWVFLLRYVPEGFATPGMLGTRPLRPGGRLRPEGHRSCWRCCWCSAWWAVGSSPAACSRP